MPQETTWKLRKSFTCSDISTTIPSVIAARIDRLEADMKRILQETSVIGRYFYYEILSRINGFEENLRRHLSSLETLDLIKARSYRPAVEYIFKHALTQEVVYSSLLIDLLNKWSNGSYYRGQFKGLLSLLTDPISTKAEKCATEALAYIQESESTVMPDKIDVDSVNEQGV